MRFVIIASPRTGSSHLVSLLGAHPEIFCNGNVFHPKTVWVFWPEADLDRATRRELRRLRATDPVALMNRVFATDYGRSHVGFKIFEGQNDEMLHQLICDDEVRKIVLYRKNVLANFSSMVVARATQKFSAIEGKQVGEPPKIGFSAQKFLNFHSKYNAFYRSVIERLNKQRQAFHFINYDEINDPYLFSVLINFIGADPAQYAEHLEYSRVHIKQNTSDICSRFSNPEKVLHFLTEHNLLHWAHEGETSLDRLHLDPSSAESMAEVLESGSDVDPDEIDRDGYKNVSAGSG